jgi:hypothetical protein
MDVQDIICPWCQLTDVVSVRLRLVSPPSKFALVAVYGEGQQDPVILDSYEPERDIRTSGRKLRAYSSSGQRGAIAFIWWQDKQGQIHQCDSCRKESALAL